MFKNDWMELLKGLPAFQYRLVSALEELVVYEKCQGLMMDHVCIRLRSRKAVFALKEELVGYGNRVVSSASVAGRQIFIIEFLTPLKIAGWFVPYLELPYPKEVHKHRDGWEHVEFVLPCTEDTMSALRVSFRKLFPAIASSEKLKKEYKYSESIPSAEGEQLPNPTISLKVGLVGIKFHPKSIGKVVAAEAD